MSNADSFTKTQPSITADKELAKHFDGGAGSPVAVVANADHADAVKTAFASVKGIDPASIEVTDGKATLPIVLPRQAVSLIVVEW